MYCKYLSKKLNGGFKCLKHKSNIISLLTCKNCPELILKRNKGIRKVTDKQKELNKNRFSIFTNDFNKCYYCKKSKKENEKLDLHEVYGGSNRTRSIKNGFVIPLCRMCHSNEEIIRRLRIIIQKEYEKTHTRQEFIQIFSKNYIKEE